MADDSSPAHGAHTTAPMTSVVEPVTVEDNGPHGVTTPGEPGNTEWSDSFTVTEAGFTSVAPVAAPFAEGRDVSGPFVLGSGNGGSGGPARRPLGSGGGNGGAGGVGNAATGGNGGLGVLLGQTRRPPSTPPAAPAWPVAGVLAGNGGNGGVAGSFDGVVQSPVVAAPLPGKGTGPVWFTSRPPGLGATGGNGGMGGVGSPATGGNGGSAGLLGPVRRIPFTTGPGAPAASNGAALPAPGKAAAPAAVKPVIGGFGGNGGAGGLGSTGGNGGRGGTGGVGSTDGSFTYTPTALRAALLQAPADELSSCPAPLVFGTGSDLLLGPLT